MKNLVKSVISFVACSMAVGFSFGVGTSMRDYISYKRHLANIAHTERCNKERVALYKALIQNGVSFDRAEAIAVENVTSSKD